VLDTNYWKSFVHARLKVSMGDGGCLSLVGRRPYQHRMLSEHLTSEYRVRTPGRGRTVDESRTLHSYGDGEWKVRAGKPDNHWLDCLVGCAVAASVQGAVLYGTDSELPPARQRIKLSELQRGRR
jgi:hypothetical protein